MKLKLTCHIIVFGNHWTRMTCCNIRVRGSQLDRLLHEIYSPLSHSQLHLFLPVSSGSKPSHPTSLSLLPLLDHALQPSIGLDFITPCHVSHSIWPNVVALFLLPFNLVALMLLLLEFVMLCLIPMDLLRSPQFCIPGTFPGSWPNVTATPL